MREQRTKFWAVCNLWSREVALSKGHHEVVLGFLSEPNPHFHVSVLHFLLVCSSPFQVLISTLDPETGYLG